MFGWLAAVPGSSWDCLLIMESSSSFPALDGTKEWCAESNASNII